MKYDRFYAVSLSQWSRGEALKDCRGQPIEVSVLSYNHNTIIVLI